MKRLEEEGLTSNSKIAWNLITEWIREWPQIHTIFSHLSLKRQRNRDKLWQRPEQWSVTDTMKGSRRERGRGWGLQLDRKRLE